MLDIEIKTIPQKEQRYVTVGDYFKDGEKDCFRISDCGNRKYEWMIAIHELIEKALCEHAGITNAEIDAFDFKQKGLDEELGDELDSPYRDQHCYATAAERMLCAAMGISWKEYDQFLCDLEQEENNMKNSTSATPTDGPLKSSLEGQMQIEPKMVSTKSMKAGSK